MVSRRPSGTSGALQAVRPRFLFRYAAGSPEAIFVASRWDAFEPNHTGKSLRIPDKSWTTGLLTITAFIGSNWKASS